MDQKGHLDFGIDNQRYVSESVVSKIFELFISTVKCLPMNKFHLESIFVESRLFISSTYESRCTTSTGEGNGTHFSILARILNLQGESPRGLQSMGCRRAGQD